MHLCSARKTVNLPAGPSSRHGAPDSHCFSHIWGSVHRQASESCVRLNCTMHHPCTLQSANFITRGNGLPATASQAPPVDLVHLPHTVFHRVKTLVLDLDDLLVHKEWTRQSGWKIFKRPGVQVSALSTRIFRFKRPGNFQGAKVSRLIFKSHHS